MLIFEIVGMAWRALGVNKLRSALTTSGITIGIFSVISVMTTISALQSSIETGLTFLGSNIFQFSKWPAGSFNTFGDDRFKNLKWNVPASDIKSMNSQNHKKAGQNVLYNDGHVIWCDSPFVGIDHHNIYTRAGDTANKRGTPHGKDDTVLLPMFPLADHLQ